MGTIGNSRVSYAARMQNEEVVVVGDDYPTFRNRESDVFFIVRARESGIRGGCHVNPTSSQAESNGRGNVFVKVKPDHRGRPCR